MAYYLRFFFVKNSLKKQGLKLFSSKQMRTVQVMTYTNYLFNLLRNVPTLLDFHILFLL